MILLGESVLLKWCCSRLWRLFHFVAMCMGWVSFLVRIGRLVQYGVSSLAFSRILCPSVWRTAYHCPGMAFVVVQGGVYHRLLFLVASRFLVRIGVLRFLCLHVNYCLLRICGIRWGEDCLVWPKSGKILLPSPQMDSYTTCDVEGVGKVVRRYLPRHCRVRGC